MVEIRMPPPRPVLTIIDEYRYKESSYWGALADCDGCSRECQIMLLCSEETNLPIGRFPGKRESHSNPIGECLLSQKAFDFGEIKIVRD